MFQRRIIWFIGIASFAFVSSFLYALWVLGSPSRLPTLDGQRHVSQIADGAEFVRTYVFDEAVWGGSVVSSVLQNWVGMTSTEFARQNPHWHLVSFSPDRIVVEELCSDDLEGGFIRAENGLVYLYHGSMDGCHLRKEPIEVDFFSMSPFQTHELQTGIPFGTETDLSLILDGMRAP